MDGQDHWLVLTSNLIYSINQGCTDTGVQYSTRIRKICANTMTQIPVYMYVYDNLGGVLSLQTESDKGFFFQGLNSSN